MQGVGDVSVVEISSATAAIWNICKGMNRCLKFSGVEKLFVDEEKRTELQLRKCYLFSHNSFYKSKECKGMLYS